jgi:hypothetical protein
MKIPKKSLFVKGFGGSEFYAVLSHCGVGPEVGMSGGRDAKTSGIPDIRTSRLPVLPTYSFTFQSTHASPSRNPTAAPNAALVTKFGFAKKRDGSGASITWTRTANPK